MNYYGNPTPLTGGQFNFSAYPMGGASANQPVAAQASQSQPSLLSSILPSPTGNVYSINNSYEVVNIPAGLGTSAALCMNENILYLKSMQNGSPVLLGYKLVPMGSEEEKRYNDTPDKADEDKHDKYTEDFKFYDKKFKFIEDEIDKLKEKIRGLVECQF